MLLTIVLTAVDLPLLAKGISSRRTRDYFFLLELEPSACGADLRHNLLHLAPQAHQSRKRNDYYLEKRWQTKELEATSLVMEAFFHWSQIANQQKIFLRRFAPTDLEAEPPPRARWLLGARGFCLGGRLCASHVEHAASAKDSEAGSAGAGADLVGRRTLKESISVITGIMCHFFLK